MEIRKKLRIDEAIKIFTADALAKAMGYSQPYMSQIKTKYPDAWVYFEKSKPVRIEYTAKHVILKKSKK